MRSSSNSRTGVRDTLTVSPETTNLFRMTTRDQLLEILARRSAKRGQFTLASGKSSTLYIDARVTTMSPDGLSLIGPLFLNMLNDTNWNITAVGGLTLGADPIAYAISYASATSKKPLRAFTVRKEPKTHGTGKLIEGPFLPGDHVAIVEDVITTGRSALRAIEAVQSTGGTVKGVISLVDRMEGGCEAIEQAGYPVVAFATASEITDLMLPR
jgi:orotate phosphoribosyltransferase